MQIKVLFLILAFFYTGFAFARTDAIAYVKSAAELQKDAVSTEVDSVRNDKSPEKSKNEQETEIIPSKNLPRNVAAPAVQFKLDDYKDYFVKSSDYRVNLKSKNLYLINCDEDIIGINWGDLENIKIFDIFDELLNRIDKKSALLKLRYETYSYIRLYKASGDIANIILSVNPVFEEQPKLVFGNCKITPYRG